MATRDKSAVIEATLCGLATGVTCVGHGRWQFVRANGSVVPMHAHLIDTWLELTTNVPETASDGITPHSWLRFNAALDGPVRAVCAPGSRRVWLSADVNLEEDVEVGEHVASLCDEMGAALHRSHVEHERMASPLAQNRSHSATDDIARLCGEARWPSSRGAAGEWRIDVNSGAGLTAYLDPDHSETLRVVIELADLCDYSGTSLHAVGLILLAVSASVRSVRGLLVERNGAEYAALATAAPWPGSAMALDRSLSALAVAHQAVWREVSALCDESLARTYVERWNFPRSSDNRVVNSNLINLIKEEHTCLQQP
jgi:hypothetical protein